MPAQAERFGLCNELRQVGGADDLCYPVESARRAEHHGHLVPTIRETMTERVRGAVRIWAEPVSDHKEHSGCAKRKERLTRAHYAETDSTRGVVSAAACNHDTGDAEFRGSFGGQNSRRARPINEARHLRTTEICRRKHRVGPLTSADVQPARAGGIGHIADLLAGQPQTDVIFGQYDKGSPADDVRLVTRASEELRGGEPRHHAVAGDGARCRLTAL